MPLPPPIELGVEPVLVEDEEDVPPLWSMTIGVPALLAQAAGRRKNMQDIPRARPDIAIRERYHRPGGMAQ